MTSRQGQGASGEAADEVFFTRPHGEWTDDRIDAWLIARDIDRDHVTETTAKAWSAAGELVVQHRQALERLALHLVDAGEMSGAEVDAVLGDLRPPQGIATKREHAFTPWDAPIIADLVRQDGSVGGWWRTRTSVRTLSTRPRPASRSTPPFQHSFFALAVMFCRQRRSRICTKPQNCSQPYCRTSPAGVTATKRPSMNSF